jgi:lipopolysaccharide export system permease protein
MIIDRYLIREILKPLTVVLSVLVILFTSYGAQTFLSDAVNALLPTNMIVRLVGLRTLIALDVLIPISLYLSVVLAFGRMWSDSEFAAMFALGYSQTRVMGVVVAFSLCVALAVGGLSLFARPWAYEQRHELADLAAGSLNTRDMKAGTFYVDGSGHRAIFIERRALREAPGHDVFVQLEFGGSTRIIHAGSASEVPDAGLNGSELRFTDAHVYEIGHAGRGSNLVLNSKDLVLRLPNPQIRPPEYSSNAASSAHLAWSHSRPDIAEFQWRLSTSCSTLLLATLAVPLSRSKPRRHRQAKIGTAILLYAGYYFLYDSVVTWVRSGALPAFPGVWLAPAVLAVILLAALLGPKLAWRRKPA